MTSTPTRTRLPRASSTRTSRIPGFENLVTEEVEVPGHDGTMIPLSIIHRKDLKLDGSAQCDSGRIRRLRHQLHAGVQRAPLDRAARRRARLRARPRRQREGRGLVQGRLQDDQAEHVEGLHLVGRVPDQEGIHECRTSWPAPAPAPAASSSAAPSRSGRICSPPPSATSAVANAMRVEFSPNGPVNTPEFGTVKDETEAQGAVRNGRRAARASRREISRRAWRGRLERSARRAVAAGQVRRGDAGGQHVRQAGAAEGQLRQRPLHRREDRHVQELRRASSPSCSGRPATRSFSPGK